MLLVMQKVTTKLESGVQDVSMMLLPNLASINLK